ncbi:MAG: hypothetical protein AB8V23_02355 [Candidatus Midichloria sp.]
MVNTNYDSNTVAVLTGRGDRTFQPAVSYTVGRGSHGIKLLPISITTESQI